MPYGFEVRRADGSVALSTCETLPRIVHVERVNGMSATTFSVPNFDAEENNGVFSGSGFFYVQYVIQNRENNQIFSGSAQPTYGAMVLPQLDWDNVTKIMSFAPASIPGNWPFRTVPNYDIIFMHYR